MRRRTVLLTFGFVILLLASVSGPASAQCAMCATALEQNGGQVAASFNRAILFLLVMPYLVFASIAGSWYWKRRKSNLVAGATRINDRSVATGIEELG